MASARDLPDEILLHIVNSGVTGDPWKDTRWFQKLSRVNRQLYDIASPLSFKDFLKPRNPGPYDQKRKYNDLWETGKWAKIVLEDDNKAALVETVTIAFPYQATFGKSRDGGTSTITSLTADSAPHALKTIDRAFKDDEARRKEWLEHCFEKHTPEYVTALVIVQLPNLRLLDLQNSVSSIWDVLSVLVSALIRNARETGADMPLKALKTVITGVGGGNKYPEDTKSLAIAASWPHVQSIIAGYTADGDNDHDPPQIPEFMNLAPKSNDLQHIRMRPECKLLSEHLHKLIGSAKALEEFDYHIGHAWGWIGIQPAKIAEALSQQEESLKEIILHHMDHEKDMSDDLEYHTWQPMSFSNFKVLEDLEISALMLFGMIEGLQLPKTRQHALQALPSSIKVFSIVQCDDKNEVETAMDAFKAIAHAKKERFLELRELHLAAFGHGGVLTRAMDMARAEQWSAANDVKLVLWECSSTGEDEAIVFLPVQLDQEEADD